MKLGLQGEIICNSKTMHNIWKCIASSPENLELKYVPRPDWPGVIEGTLNVNLFIPPSEICAHYDGYGYMTTLTEFIGPLISKSKVWSFTECRDYTNGIIDSDEIAQFKRENYIALSKLLIIYQKSAITKKDAYKKFHEKVQELTTRAALQILLRANRKERRQRPEDIEKLVFAVKGLLLGQIDSDMSKITNDMYQGILEYD